MSHDEIRARAEMVVRLEDRMTTAEEAAEFGYAAIKDRAELLTALDAAFRLHQPIRDWSKDPRVETCPTCITAYPCATVRAVTEALG